jgi:hypothetical protein
MKNSHDESVTVEATLDLHGYRKEDALRQVSGFLEQHTSGWVCIITGTGSHSPQGPVLRTAVHDYLKKRQMTFYIMRGKGGFTVDSASGRAVQSSCRQAQDTKVSVVAIREIQEKNLVERRPAAAINPALSDPRLVHHPIPRNDCGLLLQDRPPLLKQLQEVRQKQREDSDLDRVLQESSTEFEHESRVRQHEEHLLQKALQQSAEIHHRDDEDEEGLLQKVLSMSQLCLQEEEQRRTKQDEGMLQRALSLSELEHSELDEELQQALKVSLQDSVMDDDDLLRHVLQASLQDTYGNCEH